MAQTPKPGKWAGKTKNLTAAQQKKAVRVVGGGRTEKIKAGERKAAKKEVSIGETKWQTKAERGGTGRGGLLVDASGKAVTGTVTLPGGKKVQYVRGKRASVMPTKKAAPAKPPAKRKTVEDVKPTTKLTRGQKAEAARYSGLASAKPKQTQREKYVAGGGSKAGPNAKGTSKNLPKVGAIKYVDVPAGGGYVERRARMRWNGTRWVRESTMRK